MFVFVDFSILLETFCNIDSKVLTLINYYSIYWTCAPQCLLLVWANIPEIRNRPWILTVHRLNTIIECTGALSYHGFLPTLVRQCISHMTGMYCLPLSQFNYLKRWALSMKRAMCYLKLYSIGKQHYSEDNKKSFMTISSW